jgi:hypothetical protein
MKRKLPCNKQKSAVCIFSWATTCCRGDALMSSERYEKGKKIAGSALGKAGEIKTEEIGKISPNP